VFPVELAGQGQ